MKHQLLLTLGLLMTSLSFGQTYFSKQEVREELNTLKKTLIDAHYNAFAYTTPEAFEAGYQDVYNKITQDSLSLLETTNLLQQLPALLKNGHTLIDFPAPSYIAYAQEGGTVFPLELAFEADTVYVRKNWSTEAELNPGTRLLRINGQPITEIVSRIRPQIAAERPYFSNAFLEGFSFPRYYWQVFGTQENFSVTLQEDGHPKTYTLAAIPAIEAYEMRRNEVINSTQKLQFYEQAAYLSPGAFSGALEEYKSFIDSAFTAINTRKSANLIIDLRNNPGGDDAFSDYLVGYLARQPFQWNSSFRLKTSEALKAHIRAKQDTTAAFWKRALNRPNGTQYAYRFEPTSPQPEHLRYTGKVYALINRQSYSQAAVTAAQLQDYKLATLVGEETADYPSLYASVFRYTLPITGIEVQIAKGYIVRVNGSERAEGVLPDLFIRDHLLDEEDEILNQLLKHLSKS